MRKTIPVSTLLLAGALLSTSQTAPEQKGNISGTVVNRAGQPVPDAALQVMPVDITALVNPNDRAGSEQRVRERVQQSRTNAEGKFTFNGLPSGEYRLRITHPAYVPVMSGTGAPGVPANLILKDGQNMTGLVFTLDPGATVIGRIVDGDGDPLSKLRVEVLRPYFFNGRRRFSAVAAGPTGDNGEFKVTGVPPGRYYVKAGGTNTWAITERAPIPNVKPGAKDLRQFCVFYGGTTQLKEALLVSLASGQEFSVGEMTMLNKPYIHVRGKVIGDPALLAGARVVRMGWEPGSSLDWTGGADIQPDGSFDKANIWPDAFTFGVYKLQGGLLGWAALTTTDEDTQGFVINAVASPLDATVRIDAELPEGAVKPTGNLLLTAAEGPSVITARAQAPSDGAFHFPLLAPGKYIAEVTGLPAGWYVKSMFLDGRESLDNGLNFSGGGAKLEIILSPKAASIEGAVVDKEGKPVQGKVTLVPDTPNFGHARLYPAAVTSADGSFKLSSVTPGRYHIYAWEDILDTAHWDPAYTQPFRSSSMAVEVKEGEHARLTVKRISAATMEQILPRYGY